MTTKAGASAAPSNDDTGASDFAALDAAFAAAGMAGGGEAVKGAADKPKKPAGIIVGDEDDEDGGEAAGDVDGNDDGDAGVAEDGEGGDEDGGDKEDDEDGKADEKAKAAKKKTDDEDDDDLDPATRRKLAAVQKDEKRAKAEIASAKAALAAEEKRIRGEIDAEVKKWEPRIAAAEKFEAAMAGARRDPVGLLLAAGLTSEEIEEASKQAYLYAKGDKDPKTRAAAQRLQREREERDDVATLRKKLEALEQERVAEKQQATLAQAREKFTDSLVAAAKAMAEDAEDRTAVNAAPVVMKQLGKNAVKTREKLFAIADEMGRKTGEPPDPDDVIAELEKRERADLEDRGVDLAVYLGTTAAAPAKKSKTIGRTGGGAKTGRVPQTDDELAAEVARELAEGRHLAH